MMYQEALNVHPESMIYVVIYNERDENPIAIHKYIVESIKVEADVHYVDFSVRLPTSKERAYGVVDCRKSFLTLHEALSEIDAQQKYQEDIMERTYQDIRDRHKRIRKELIETILPTLSSRERIPIANLIAKFT